MKNTYWKICSLEVKLRPLSLMPLGCSCVASDHSRILLLFLCSSQRLAVAFGHSELSSIVLSTRGQEWWQSWKEERMWR